MENGTKKIKSYHLLDVEVITDPNEEIRDHLGSMVQGTPGGLTFINTNFHLKLNHLGEPYFLTLKKAGRLLGTICLVHRPLYHENSVISTWYLRYFHVKAPLRATSGRQRNLRRDSPAANRIIFGSVEKYFTNPEILLPEEKQNMQSLLFGFIVKNNLRSSKWADQVGIFPYKSLKLFIFTRLNPKDDERVQKITTDAIPGMKEKLGEFYKDYSLYTDQNLFYDNNYYIIRERDEIVAGMQANPEEWNIIDRPGISGFISHKILPRIPQLSKILNLKEFRFAGIEGIYFKTGYEHLLSSLLETVCYRYRIHFAFCYTDLHSPLMATLRQHVRKGLVSRFIHPEIADIRIKFYNWNEEDEKRLVEKPCYVSCFDST